MTAALAVLSFICAALLAVFIPVKRVRESVPHLAVVLWLVGYNVVHGINAVVWYGNVGDHAPVWCDIVTKLMLGANIALPGALLCIARDLEHVSSSRPYVFPRSTIRNRTILELVLCYVIPLIYMLLHIVAQDRRFDLLKDYGCSASIQPSLFPFFLVWLPPLIICSIAFVLCVFAVSHTFRFTPAQFVVHVESRLDTIMTPAISSSSSSIFNRRLAICILTTATIFVTRIFSLFINPRFVPWVSWEAAHRKLSQVEILTSTIGVRAARFEWWGVFAVSIVYVLLAHVLGEESRDVGQWIMAQGAKKRSPLGVRKLILPLSHSRNAPQEMTTVSRSASLSKPQPRPLTLELRSGWDDMLDIKTPKFKTSFKGLLSPRPPSPTCTSPTPSTSSTADEDRAFAASTLSYIGSSTAKSLGISSQTPLPRPPPPPPAPLIPSQVSTPPQQRPTIMIQIPPVPTSPPPPPPVALPRSQSRESERLRRFERPGQDAETLSTVLEASWPLPPNSPVPSLVPSRHAGRTVSRSGSIHRSGSGSASPTSSVEEESSFGYPLYPTVTPPHLRSRPFEGSSISSIADIPASPGPSPIKPLKSILKRPSIKSLRRSWSKESLGQGQGQVSVDLIRMSVVQETV